MKHEDRIQEYLRLLDLKVPFTPEELQRQYRDLVQVWHPDRHAHNERLKDKAEEKLKLINEAYEQLSKNVEAVNQKFGRDGGRSRTRQKSTGPKADAESKPSKYMRLASAAIEAQNYAEAYRYSNKCLEHDPDSYLAWMGKGTSAGWLSTFLQSRLSEMSACYARALQLAPVDRRAGLPNGMAVAKAQVVDGFFRACKSALLQALPTAGVGAGGIPHIWAHYVGLCGEMLQILEEVHQSLPEPHPDILRLIIEICADNLTGVKYTDYTTVRFNSYASRAVFLVGEFEEATRKKMLGYADKLKAIEPGFVAPQINKASPDCFIATCVCGSADHPHVVALRRFRDTRLQRCLVGRRLIAIYHEYGPHVAALIQHRRHLKRILAELIVHPLAIFVSKCSR